MAERPEYVCCISRPVAELGVWCGRAVVFDFRFTGLDHAAQAVLTGDRLVPCPECVAAAMEILVDVEERV